jgi:hypothetical protein
MMHNHKAMFSLLAVITLLIVAGCAPDVGGGEGDPAPVVERYVRARVERDAAVIRGLLCSEMEAQAESEVQTFASVTGVEIEDMRCARRDGQNVVSCTGQIVAQYGAESTTFPLVSYRVVQEDGEWKWCGEAE